MITIDKLKKNFGEKVAVDIEHYEINQGDMLGLVGNNGAGKTTLFRLMLDLLKADDGKVIINDIDVSQSEDWKSITGAFIDDGFLIDYLTPEEYFYFIGKMYGLKRRSRRTSYPFRTLYERRSDRTQKINSQLLCR